MKVQLMIILSILIGFTINSCSGQDSSGEPKGVQNIDQSQFESLASQEDVIVIDVRTPEEIDGGYIEGADEFYNFRSPQFKEEIKKLDKTKKYVVYCRSGGRSASAANLMIENGFSEVYNLKGGITNWSGSIVKE